MRLTLVSGEIGYRTSGQSRFGMNLARGLSDLGHQVTICAGAITRSAEEALRADGIRVLVVARGFQSEARRSLALTPLSTMARRLAGLVRSAPDSDWTVTVSDTAIGVVDYLPDRRTAYVCNGDVALLFVGSRFYRTHRAAKRLLSLAMASDIRRNAASAARYRIRVANSQFTQQFMSYLYSLPFEGVVYPPVDTTRFAPDPGQAGRSGYVGLLARNENEPGLDLIPRLTAGPEIRVAGGAVVAGTKALGMIEDPELIEFYRRARFIVFPVISEFFGYAIAEAHACGTPVLAFDYCGAAEQIRSGRTGWLVRNEAEFVSEYRRICEQGYPPEMNEECRRSASTRSIAASSRALLDALESAA